MAGAGGGGWMSEQTFTSAGVVNDTQRGLLDEPKWLSSLYFYDAHGSKLFEDICKTPEYYVTRTEEAILAENLEAILAAAGSQLALAELGSGSSAKTKVLIEGLLRRQNSLVYCPNDVSETMLAQTARQLEAAYVGLNVKPVVAEYGEGLREIGAMEHRPKLVLFLGSSLGNFEPPEQVELLRHAARCLAPGDAFLLGTDLVKDPDVLHSAYNDAAGVTAAFNKNILTHLNRELDGDADPDAFTHIALWNPERQRIEMHLESRIDQTIRFPAADLEVPLHAGERIHTENSYKFTLDGVAQMARDAGFQLEQTWTDDNQWFALHLLRR